MLQAPDSLLPALMRMLATASREIAMHICGRTMLADHTLMQRETDDQGAVGCLREEDSA